MPDKVRLIAKIRRLTELENGAPWISLNKPQGDASQTVTITFEGQSPSSYDLDFCYAPNDGTDFIFSREVKPLIPALFDGRNATVIACGARRSGKTHTIQGTAEKPGLAVLALEELLSLAPTYGKSISISFYEIDHEHVYDLLPPKRQHVLILKDAQGKIQLKGLSQVVLASPSEIHKLYSTCCSRKTTHKIANGPPTRSHIGLTIHVSSLGETMSKINFVDLSGYEDARRKSFDGFYLAENAKINKSIYALHNVLYALNANESHIPFRESKLTHFLQDSLGGASKILMITCLNPSFCQDSLYMMNLASRSYQGTKRVVSDSTKMGSLHKTRTPGTNLVISDSAKSIASSLPKTRTPGTLSNTMKKQTKPQVHFSRKKENCSSSALKVRKLFDGAPVSDDGKESCINTVPAIECSLQEEEGDSSLLPPKDANSLSMEGSLLTASNSEEAIVPNKDVSSHSEESKTVISSIVTMSILGEGANIEKENNNSMAKGSESPPISLPIAASPGENIEKENNSSLANGIEPPPTGAPITMLPGETTDKENKSSQANRSESPPISARLQELSNNLKLLYTSISPHVETAPPPSYLEIKPNNEISRVQTSADFVEPRTPDQNMKVNDKDIVSFYSPWEEFHARSFGAKNSLVQDYLKFLNSASKEELKKLKGIGEKRATYILELREESPEPFKQLDDLKDIGLSAKQIKRMMEKEVGGLFK